MFTHLEQKRVRINASRGYRHFKAGQRFFVETSAMHLGSLFKSRVNWCRDVLKSDSFHGTTITQPLRLSTRGS